MDMDISMDIHAKYVDMDMDMDVKFHIHGNSAHKPLYYARLIESDAANKSPKRARSFNVGLITGKNYLRRISVVVAAADNDVIDSSQSDDDDDDDVRKRSECTGTAGRLASLCTFHITVE